MNVNKCGECKHFEERTDPPSGVVMVQKDKKREGICMHSPPVVVMIPGQMRGQMTMQFISMYPPLVEDSNACGQFAPRLQS